MSVRGDMCMWICVTRRCVEGCSSIEGVGSDASSKLVGVFVDGSSRKQAGGGGEQQI
jgi:hypothetical protein